MASLNNSTEDFQHAWLTAWKDSKERCVPYSCRRPVRCQPAPTAQIHQLPFKINMTPRLHHTRPDIQKVLLNQFWVSYIFRTLLCFVKKKKSHPSSSLLVKSYQPTRTLPDEICCGIELAGTYVYVRYKWGIKPIADHLVAVTNQRNTRIVNKHAPL